MRVALCEWEAATEVGDPRMLLHKPEEQDVREIHFVQPRKVGRSPDSEPGQRFGCCSSTNEAPTTSSSDCTDVRAERAHRLIQVGELSAARQALEGDPPAPGHNATLRLLRDPDRRPAAPRGPLAPVDGTSPDSLVDLEKDRLLKNLRSARRRAAGGPSGMTAEHVRPVLDSERDGVFLAHVWEFARAGTLDEVVQALRIDSTAEAFRWSARDGGW